MRICVRTIEKDAREILASFSIVAPAVIVPAVSNKRLNALNRDFSWFEGLCLG